MGRALRIEYAGAFYHVMSRGNNGNKIFFGEHGQEQFLKVLAEVCQRSGWIVHAYVLMSNHYHLLIETPEPNLVSGMKWLQGTYTKRVNTWTNRRGHLFQGRYKAQVVNGDSMESRYFQTVGDYIHLNPARAKMTGKAKKWKSLKDYPWSSLAYYGKWKSKRPSWLQVEKLLATYSLKDSAKGRDTYVDSIEAKGADTGKSYRALERGWCVGDGTFKQKVLDKAESLLSKAKRESLSGSAVRAHDERAAQQYLDKGLTKLSLKHKDLAKMPKSALEKKALAVWLSQNTLASNAWIACNLSMGHLSSVTQAKIWFRETKDANKWIKKLNSISIN